ncbi:gem-associated protein 5 [Schistocerca nitens]|uniref:gem-associated protein 5 n=1 Tax=Schistocerca nitens TaxID=7011 RepID=UPI002117E54A|nr:gem-associated protein 5 [Schistocerca nitens]
MDEQIFPPSPNWYSSNVISCGESGRIAYASRNNIVLVNTPAALTVDCKIICEAHKDKVNAITFCKSVGNNSYTNWLASVGGDSVVKMWDTNLCTVVLAHNAHGMADKITCMDWSPADPHLVVSADESNLFCWDLKSNTTRCVKPGKLLPTSLSCSWHEKSIVALGTKYGLVCVVDIRGDGKILYRMRGHSTEVVSLSWCPVSQNVCSQQEENKDMLLASGGKDKEVYVWRAGGDGRYELLLNLPDAPLTGQHRKGPSASAGGSVNWVSVCWPTGDTLLTNSLWGELLSWNVRKIAAANRKGEGTRRKPWKLIHSCHARGLFSIMCIPCMECGVLNNTLEEVKPDAKQCEKNHIVWTAAQDRHIIGCDLHTGKVAFDIATMGGFVYCLAVSPLDTNRIAVGVGDAMIRVWNLSNKSKIDITAFWQKINGKVTALAWHPIEEDRLAYGTAEGRVGIMNVSSGGPPTVLKLYHRRTVYSLTWGPSLSKGSSEAADKHLLLYSCGDGEVVIYDPKKPDTAPRLLNSEVRKESSLQNKGSKTEVSWNSECSLLAVGNDDGSVQVWKIPDLLEIKLYPHKKAIQSLVWHPASTYTDTEFSVCRNWLAVASNETVIKVYDLKRLLEGSATTDRKPMAELSGHLSRVVSVSWSPHISGQLVSASYDGTAQVWDVRSQQPIANCSLHSDAVLCCLWSPLDPDYIITGSADNTLCVWKISKQTNKVPIENRKQKKQAKMHSKTVSKMLAQNAEDKLPQGNSVGNNGTSDAVAGGIEYATTEKGSIGKQLSKSTRLQIRKSHFPVSSQQRSLGKVEDFARIQRMLSGSNIGPTFFGPREDLVKLLDAEEELHTKNGHFEFVQEMEHWKGNLANIIKEATERKSLSDWLVSLSPMISQRVWRETVEVYAKQLTDAGFYHKAASYLLVLNKVNEAVKMLSSNKLHREALSIAKCRLSEDDPLIKNVLHEWATHLINGGSYEQATECLLATGDMVEAAKVIAKRPEPEALCIAVQIAQKAGDLDLANAFLKKSVCEYLLHEKWDSALEMLHHNINNNNTLKFLVIVHKTLITMRNSSMESSDKDNWAWLQGYSKNTEPLTEKIKALWVDYSGTPSIDVIQEGILEKNFSLPLSTKELWLAVSENVCAACSTNGEERLHHLIHALGKCYQFELCNPDDNSLLQLSMWLAPRGPLQDELFKVSDHSNMYLHKSIRCYIVAEICRWVENISVGSETKRVSQSSKDVEGSCDGYDDGVTTNIVVASHSYNGKEVTTSKDDENIQSEEKNGLKVSITSEEIVQPGKDAENSEESFCIIGRESNDKNGEEVKTDSDKVYTIVENEQISQLQTTAGNLKEITIAKENEDWACVCEILKKYFPDVIEESAIRHFKNQLEVKKLEQQLANCIAKSQQNTSPLSDEHSENEKLLATLTKLKQEITVFEAQRVNVPNPFISYCKMVNVCQIIAEKFPVEGNELLENVKSSWNLKIGSLS